MLVPLTFPKVLIVLHEDGLKWPKYPKHAKVTIYQIWGPF